MAARILIIDDDAGIRESVRQILEYNQFECVQAADGAEGLAFIEREPPDVVLLDIKMPGLDGLEVLSRIKEVHETLPVIIITAHGTRGEAFEASQRGALQFLEKPFGENELLLHLRSALEERQLRTENVRLREENRAFRRAAELRHSIVGESPALARVMDAVRRAAPTNATVLILGESGVGKELIARAIHRNSNRARERFVQVNCAAIPDDLIESELFGHEKGAFTGAVDKQIGKFEQADRGTVFLDEVGDMSLRTQAKVLRVLQEGEVERLGSARTLKVDVRVIAATNKNLDQEIEKATFREDLYFRLSVIPIAVPPLRERPEDIPVLIRHFADLFSRENNFRPKRFSSAAFDLMKQHRWKGNVRELRNTVERLLIMAPGEGVDVADVRGALRVDARAEAPDNRRDEPPGTLREFKETSERAFIVAKLREHNWNISKTADAIGTPRSNLYKKLEQYGIRQETDG